MFVCFFASSDGFRPESKNNDYWSLWFVVVVVVVVVVVLVLVVVVVVVVVVLA